MRHPVLVFGLETLFLTVEVEDEKGNNEDGTVLDAILTVPMPQISQSPG